MGRGFRIRSLTVLLPALVTISLVIGGSAIARTGATALPSGASTAVTLATTTPQTVLLYGDSITQGTAAHWTWRYRLWKGLQAAGTPVHFVGPMHTLWSFTAGDVSSTEYRDPNFDTYHAAYAGMTLQHPVWTVAQLAQQYHPNVIVGLIGLNDLVQYGATTQALIDTWRQQITAARQADPGVTIVLAQYGQVWAQGVPAYNAALTQLAQQTDLPSARVVVAQAPAFSQQKDTFDGVDLTSSGEILQAQSVAAALAQVGLTSAAAPADPPDNGQWAPTPTVSLSGTAITVSWPSVDYAYGEDIYLRDDTTGWTGNGYVGSGYSFVGTRGHTYEVALHPVQGSSELGTSSSWVSVTVPATAPPQTILLYGDAITQGTAAHWTWRYRLWKGLQAAGTPVHFVGPMNRLWSFTLGDVSSTEYRDPNFDTAHAAYAGMTLQHPVWTIAQLAQQYHPTVVVGLIGLSDLVQYGATTQALIDTWRQQITAARQADPGVTIVLAQYGQVWAQGVPAYNAALTQLAQQMDLPTARVLVAQAPAFNQQKDTFDGLDLTSSGEILQAQSVAAALAQAGLTSAAAPADPPDNGQWAPTPTVAASGTTVTVTWPTVDYAYGENLYIRDDDTGWSGNGYVSGTSFSFAALSGHTYEVALHPVQGSSELGTSSAWVSVTVPGTPPPPAILIYGDSITQGEAARWTWRYRLWKGLQAAGTQVHFVGPMHTLWSLTPGDASSTEYRDPNFDTSHAAYVGMTLQYPRWTMAQLAQQYYPKAIVGLIGINDLVHYGATAQSLVDIWRQQIIAARQADPRVTFVLCQYGQVWTAGVPAYNAGLSQLAQQMDLPTSRVLVAQAPAFNQQVDTFDGIHLTSSGEILQAQSVAAALAQVGLSSAAAPADPPDNGQWAPTPTLSLSGLTGTTVNVTWPTVDYASCENLYIRDDTAGSSASGLTCGTSFSFAALHGHTYEVALHPLEGSREMGTSSRWVSLTVP